MFVKLMKVKASEAVYHFSTVNQCSVKNLLIMMYSNS